MLGALDYETYTTSLYRRRKTGETVDYEMIRTPIVFPVSYGLALSKERFWIVVGDQRGELGELAADGGVTLLDAGSAFPIPVYGSWGTGMDDLWTVGDVGRAYRRQSGVWTDQLMSLGGKVPYTGRLRVVTGDGEGGLWIAGRGVALRKRGP
jgi:hypothetical protein